MAESTADKLSVAHLQELTYVIAGTQLDAAAEAYSSGLLVIDNYTVFALGGNANDPNLQDNICQAKGEKRGAKQPVGWTVPFDERVLSTIDVSAVENSPIRRLLRDPEELTRRIGGLTFIRAAASMSEKKARQIPDSVIPADQQTVQIYSPDGNDNTATLIRRAIDLGAEPVMTSANVSGEPEATDEAGGHRFALREQPPLPMVVYTSEEDKFDRPRGSYPVISVLPDRLRIVRPGCFDVALLRSLLVGYEVDVATGDELQMPKYPNNVLRQKDLPSHMHELEGAELRAGVLSYLGLSAIK